MNVETARKMLIAIMKSGVSGTCLENASIKGKDDVIIVDVDGFWLELSIKGWFNNGKKMQ